jgi:hypothetical protein
MVQRDLLRNTWTKVYPSVSILRVVEKCLIVLNEDPTLVGDEKKVLFRHMARNYGRTVPSPESVLTLL